MLIEMLFSEPLAYLAVVAIVVGSIVLHELGHALTATWQGDPTPRLHGQLSFNPLRFMPTWGLLLIAVVGIGFGATRVQPRLFRDRRWGDALVSFAGPAVNLALIAVGVVCCAAAVHLDGPATIRGFWYLVALLNVLLFLFNMLPVPPLDGFTVFDRSLGMGELGMLMRRNQPWPLVIAIVIVSNFGLLDLCENITNVLLGLLGVGFA